MDAQLKIIVGAEIADVEKKLQKLEKEAESLRKQLEKPINANVSVNLTKDLDKVNAEIAKLRQQKIDIQVSNSSVSGLKNLADGADRASSSLTKLKQATPNATFALTNLSRVAQDAPFGFIGIANNIDPLIQSFIQLKQQSGSTKGALLALGSSLAGPGGLVLLTGLATAAITLFGDKLLSGVFGASQLDKKLEDLRSKLKSLDEVKVESLVSVEGDVSYVSALAQAVTDANKPYAERKRALDELKRVNKEYFGDLTVETAAYGTLAQRVQEYSQQLVQQAVVKGLQDQITANTALRLELEKRLKVQQNEVNLQSKIVEKQRLQNKQLQQASSGGFALAAAGQASTGLGGLIDANAESKLGTLTDAYKKTRDELDKVSMDIANIQGEINKEVEKSLKLKPLGGATAVTAAKEKIKADLVTTKEVAQQILNIENDLAADLSKIQEKTITNERQQIKQRFETRLLELKKGYDKERAEAASKIYENEADKQKLLATIDNAYQQRVTAVRTELKFELSNYDKSFFDFTKTIRDRVDKDIKNKKIELTFPIEIKTKLEQLDKAREEASKQSKAAIEQLQQSILDAATESFSIIGETLGNILSGEGLGKSLAKGGEAILKIVGGVLQQLGKYTIAASTIVKALKQALSQLFSPNGFQAGLAVGIGLVALGQVLKNIKLTKIPALAEGGIVNGPTLSLIGERGSEAVIPLDKLSGMMITAVRSAINPGGARGLATTVDQRLVTEIRGSSLALVLQRTNNTASRLG